MKNCLRWETPKVDMRKACVCPEIEQILYWFRRSHRDVGKFHSWPFPACGRQPRVTRTAFSLASRLMTATTIHDAAVYELQEQGRPPFSGWSSILWRFELLGLGLVVPTTTHVCSCRGKHQGKHQGKHRGQQRVTKTSTEHSHFVSSGWVPAHGIVCGIGSQTRRNYFRLHKLLLVFIILTDAS